MSGQHAINFHLMTKTWCDIILNHPRCGCFCSILLVISSIWSYSDSTFFCWGRILNTEYYSVNNATVDWTLIHVFLEIQWLFSFFWLDFFLLSIRLLFFELKNSFNALFNLLTLECVCFWRFAVILHFNWNLIVLSFSV